MTMVTRKNVSLILAVSIPILMILAITATIYWPKVTAHPAYNFLYLISQNYSNNPPYLIQNGKLLKTQKEDKNQSN